MVKIGILTGSTRDSRVNIQVAEWVKSIADKRGDAEYELVDIKDYNCYQNSMSQSSDYVSRLHSTRSTCLV